MFRKILIVFVVLIGLSAVSPLRGIFAVEDQPASREVVRSNAQQLMRDGNWKDALAKFETALSMPTNDGQIAAQDLTDAVNCQQNLQQQAGFDALVELAVENNSQHWEVLSAAAQRYLSAYHYGEVQDAQFIRGRARSQWMNVSEQDRIRALRLLLRALELENGLDNEARLDVGPSRLYIDLANALVSDRSGQLAWRLDTLTDIDADLDYADLDAQKTFPNRYAGVKPDGQPTFLQSASSWDAAESDGQRYRWAIERARNVESAVADEASMSWAAFLQSQYSVTTLSQYRWFGRGGPGDAAEDANSISALHTLAENETIARLATGPKRFLLPSEFDFIAIYREIAGTQNSSQRRSAFQQLANIFLNRRQYVTAEKVLRQQIESLGQDQFTEQQLSSIVDPQAAFDALPTQLAGQNPELGFVYRNASKANFAVQQVDVKKLIASTKQYYRDWKADPKNANKNRDNYNLRYLQQVFADDGGERFLTGKKIEWKQDLELREDHWDRRVQITAPITNSGLYVVTASLNEGQSAASCLVWLQDTAIVKVNGDSRLRYHVIDAKTGQPTPASVDIFAWRYIRNNNTGVNRIEIVERRVATDVNGVATVPKALVNENYQLLVTADNNDGRLAFMAWESAYASAYNSAGYRVAKAYGVSDRPMYRPGETIQVNFWLGQAGYGDLFEHQQFAGRQITLSLLDPQGNEVGQQTLKSDSYGRVAGEFKLEEAAGLGIYQVMVKGESNGFLQSNLAVRVEEYRKPEFEVTVDAPTDGVRLGETIQARVSAKYYFGSPVTDAEVTVRVNRSAYSDNYYPYDPFDWCYGPGYWWWNYQYDWYPGYKSWVGCLAPNPVWWGGRTTPPELVLEDTLKLDVNGEATIEIDTALAKEMYGGEDHEYSISVEVRDASRRTILGSGSVIAAREPFKIYTWTNRGYYVVDDTIEANFKARTLAGDPVAASGQLDLLRISYNADREPIERVVESWEVETNADGELTQKIAASNPGQYRLRLRLKTLDGGDVEGGYLLTIRGGNSTGEDFRFGGLELIPQKRTYAPGETLRLQINADRADALVYLFVRPVNSVYPEPQLVRLKDKTAIVEIAIAVEDQPNFFVEAFTVYDGQVHQQTREIMVPAKEQVLDVKVTSNQKEYLPGSEAELSVHVQDLAGEPVQGSLAIAVYDRSLEQIASDVLPGDIREYFWKWRRSHYPRLTDNLSWYGYPIPIKDVLGLRPLGVFGRGVADEALRESGNAPLELADMESDRAIGMGGGGRGGMDAMASGFMSRSAETASAPARMGKSFAGGNVELGQPAAAPEPTVRKDFADSALWLVNIETDADGNATAKFRMPESLSSWQMRTWSVADGLQVGSATTQAVTRKNIMIRLQKPRFLVERDEVVISALVTNDFENAESVAVRLEIDGETSLKLMGDVAAEQTVRVDAHGQVRVDWRCKAIAEGSVTLRTIALGSRESDAMQDSMPILVNGILKTESWAGTVRDGREASTLAIRVPSERRADQSKLTIRVSPSLAAAMIDSLPYLVDYPYGCTEQTLNRFLPTVMTQRTLQRMNIDLAKLKEQRTNLNAQELENADGSERNDRWETKDRNPVYDIDEVEKMTKAGVQRLVDMQVSDGGWGWFSGPQARSYPHTTAVVVRGLILARDNDVVIPAGVIENGVAWLTQYQIGELQKLKNFASKTVPFKQVVDDTDALVLNVLAMLNQINAEMQNQLYEDRLRLSTYSKVLLALVTNNANNVDQTKMLRQNIEQFLEVDLENETAYLTTGNSWWYWYGDSIEANAMYLKLLSELEPKGENASRVVKYLLNNRRHAYYWKSTRDTALVVEAFADYLAATKEMAGNSTVNVLLDGQRLGRVTFTPETLFSADNTIEVVGSALTDGEHTLEIQREGGGNLYWNAYLTNFTLEEEIEKAGLEVRVERRYYQLIPEQKDLALPGKTGQAIETKKAGYVRTKLDDLTAVPSGTLVEVELLVESKNDYEYLLIEDRKPACLEAVETTSGYIYEGGLSIYRELRDQKVGFFIQTLPRGKYSLRYQLRTEAPGTFTALPAVIQGMYAPELVGNSRDFDFVTEDVD